MTSTEDPVSLDVCRFKTYFLRIFPLWGEETECIEIGSRLDEIVDRIKVEKSVNGFYANEAKPMKFCQIEEEETLFVVSLQKTFYENKRTPVWKLIVPKSSIYSRDTILSCIARNTGRNIDRYKNALHDHPGASQFFTTPANEIMPVDDSVFILENSAR